MRALILALLLALSGTAAGAGCAPGPAPLAGYYTLEGEREVGAELLLAPDGRFRFGLAYGAIDQSGQGCWSLRDGWLTLLPPGRRTVPARPSPLDRRFRGLALQVLPDGGLRWPLDGFRGVFRRTGG